LLHFNFFKELSFVLFFKRAAKIILIFTLQAFFKKKFKNFCFTICFEYSYSVSLKKPEERPFQKFKAKRAAKIILIFKSPNKI